MKKIFLLAFSSIALLSCGSDDEATPNNSLQGTWKVTSFTTNVPVDFNNDGVSSTNFLTESGCYDNSTLLFGNNNEVTAAFQDLDVTLDINFENPEASIYEINCLPSAAVAGTWTQNNNSVTVTIDGEPAIMILNGNTLTAVFNEFVDIETFDGTETVYEVTGATLVFTKQ